MRPLTILPALLLITACAGQGQSSLEPIPPAVEVRYVYRPMDGALLTCKAAPTETEGESQLDLAGLYNRTLDAWADCYRKLAEVRRKTTGQ